MFCFEPQLVFMRDSGSFYGLSFAKTGRYISQGNNFRATADYSELNL